MAFLHRQERKTKMNRLLRGLGLIPSLLITTKYFKHICHPSPRFIVTNSWLVLFHLQSTPVPPHLYSYDYFEANLIMSCHLQIFQYVSCLLRNLYAGQEATVRTGLGTIDWFQIGKGVHQGCILSLYLFNLYAEYIMRNAGLDEAQAGINIAGRNINNLRYADDTTLMAESEEELTSLLMKVKEESEKLA